MGPSAPSALLAVAALLAACGGGDGEPGSPTGQGTSEASPEGPPSERTPAAVDPEYAPDDWPGFLGVHGDAIHRGTPLPEAFPAGGPPLAWSAPRGSGYAPPAAVAGTLVWQHRVGDELVIECRDAASGEARWRRTHPTGYVDAYGYSDGPRASPVIAGDAVFCQNADGKLYAHALADGAPRWGHDLVGEYRAAMPFFGFCATPLAVGDLLVVPVGAPGGPCVVAFDRATGAERWRAGERWRADCASPILRRFDGEPWIVCLVGGRTRPPVGGVLVLDPVDGRIVARHKFRSRDYQSVNAANPCVIGERIILTSAYRTGDLALDLVDGELREAWWQDDLNSHWCTPVAVGDTVFVAGGRHRRGSALIAIDPADGRLRWRRAIAWEEDGRARYLGRSQLIAVGGGFLALSEDGVLVRLAADRDGCRLVDRARLFDAPQSWVAPILHRGRCYVAQVEPDRRTGEGPRWLCYDLGE